MGKVTCPTCGNLIGETFDFAGIEMLIMNGNPTIKYEGICRKCGKKFYWSVNDKKLEKIIRSVILPLKMEENDKTI